MSTTRRTYTELVRHFLAGRMTNHRYEDECDRLLHECDIASSAIYFELWNSYCDIREHRMGMRQGMTREGRRTAARWIMFLKSGRPFEYRCPKRPCSWLTILTLGLYVKYENTENVSGDHDVWPYYRRADFENDLKNPKYLSGTVATT